MIKIGITGGIGSGKSIVSGFFLEWGAYVFDADKEAKIMENLEIKILKELNIPNPYLDIN